MTKTPKMKWHREGADNHEDLYFAPVDWDITGDGTEDDETDWDAPVARIMIAYNRTRFYGGRGGEGDSRPDSYVAYVGETVVTEGADSFADVGGILSTKSAKSFRSLRAAKAAVKARLEAIAARAAAPQDEAPVKVPSMQDIANEESR